MPYEIVFSRQVAIADSELYINDCCAGGDVVLGALLPALRERYGDLHMIQEDWGWFIWFPLEGSTMAVEVSLQDPAASQFCMHLTSRTRRFWRGDRIDDTPQLEQLRDLVVTVLGAWLGHALTAAQVDANYMPIDGVRR
jgi:hypothetical protein